VGLCCGETGSTINRDPGGHWLFHNLPTPILDDRFQLLDLPINLLQLILILFGNPTTIDFPVHLFILVFLEILEVLCESFDGVVEDV